MPKVSDLAHTNNHPDEIILHAGGNDLASVTLKDLMETIKKDLTSISQLLPNTKIIWSDVLPRRSYRGAQSSAKVERSRKALNSAIRKHVKELGGAKC